MAQSGRSWLIRILLGISLTVALLTPFGVGHATDNPALAAPIVTRPNLTRPAPPPPPPTPVPAPGQDLAQIDTDTAQFIQGTNGQVNVHVYNAPAGMSTTTGWQKLDPSLTKRLPDGSFAPANLPFNLSVAPTTAGPYIVSLTDEGGVTLHLGLAPLGGGAFRSIPGRRQGSTVLYSAPDPAARRDVAVDATASGFKVRIVLHNADENPSVTLRVALDSAAYLQQEPSGTIQAIRPTTSYGDSSTTPIVSLGPEFVIGHASAVDAVAGVVAPATASSPSLTLGSSSAGIQDVSVAVNPTWLHAAGRIFPVTVTIPVATALSAAHTGIAATVNSCAPTNPAPPTDIVVGVVGSCADQGKLYFALPHVPGEPTVVSATLGLYALDQFAAAGVQVYMNGPLPLPYIAPSALDQSANFALPAAAAGAIGIPEQPSHGSNLHTWDVTSIVRQWFQDVHTNGGLTLMGGGTPVAFQSPLGSAGTNPAVDPVLSITYAPVGTVLPTTHATAPGLVPTTALTSTSALGVPAGIGLAYVATPSGLYRSTNPTFSRWEQMNQVIGITLISPNPEVPNDLVYATDNGIFRSLDGGRTAIQTSGCKLSSLVRAPSTPSVVYAATAAYKDCPFITPLYQAIIRSTDDGRSWTLAHQPSERIMQGSTIDPLAVDPTTVGHVVAGLWLDVGVPDTETIQTLGAGQPWRTLQSSPIEYGGPRILAFDPMRPHVLWTAWASSCAGELDLNSASAAHDLLTSQVPLGLAFDPLSDRLYMVTEHCQGSGYAPQAHIYTVGGATGTYLPLEKSVPRAGTCFTCLAITGNGYLLSGGSKGPLTVLKLNGPGIWSRASYFSGSAGLLGSPISPPTVCQESPCQYFEKGALLKGGSPLPLVAGLFTASTAASLPVGGTTSTVTYAGLAKSASKRTAPPVGFQHGVQVGPAGTFVPFSAQLSAKPGYIVPPFFWRFLTNMHSVPGGWLHDIGLPVTPAVRATVTKGSLGKRTITIQAFQDAILTYDPLNPSASQVERANIGSDYATAFPKSTR